MKTLLPTTTRRTHATPESAPPHAPLDWLKTYNSLQDRINSFIDDGYEPPEELLNGSHNLTVAAFYAPEYSFNGLAGCVVQRKNVQTGTTIGIYFTPQAGDDPGPSRESLFQTRCEEHDNYVNDNNFILARQHSLDPTEWCPNCKAQVDGVPCVTIRSECTGSSHGQRDGFTVLFVDGVLASYIDWSVYDGELYCKYVETIPAFRRKGYATRVIAAARAYWDDIPFHPGMTTEDGTALFATIECAA